MKTRAACFLLLVLACIPARGQALNAMKGKLKAGTAKITITPENPGSPIHDTCCARSLVLDIEGQRIAFVSVDLGIYTSDNVVKACKEKFGLSQFLLSSSHTHSGPRRGDADFREKQIIDVVGQAVEAMFPARIVAGHRTFPQLGFNRLIVRDDGHARESWYGDAHYRSENPDRIPFGPVDPQVGVIKVEDEDGTPRVIMMNYGLHADVVCSNFEVSADFPGVACRKVEEAFDNEANCLFVQAAGGNVESLILSSRRSGANDPFKTDYNAIERVGELLAYETVTLARSLTAPSDPETEITFMNDELQFGGRFNTTAKFDIRICTILINKDIVIATCPGEPFSVLALDWKKKMKGTHPFLFGYTWFEGTWPNYIPDIESAARGGYGADIEGPTMIEVGSGERIMNKHFENYYRLIRLMRSEPGPSGFKRESRWIMQEVPR